MLRVTGETPKSHGLRELLGVLARRLREAGFEGEASRIVEFVSEKRGLLVEAEEAYTLARYGSLRYTREEAWKLVGLARELIELLKGVSRILDVD